MARSAAFTLALAASCLLLVTVVAAQIDIRSSSCPRNMQRGQTGTCVTSLQNLLASKGFSPGAVDGSFGPATETAVRNFQSNRRLTVDGIVGPNTKTALYTDVDIRSSSCPSNMQRGLKGQCVTSLQKLLASKGFSPGAIDGSFGPATETAVRNFQSSRRLTVDGIVGPNTKAALYATMSGPAPTAPAPTAPAPTAPAPTSGPTCTPTEFANAVASNGYNAQPDAKRTTMLASIQRLGGAAVISTKRELAMWLAQVFHESIGLSTKVEIGGSSASYAPYYGRGYIQLTGQSNYQTASRALFGDDRLVSNPDQVATDDNISWDVSTYYWKTRVHNLSGVSTGQFGATTRGINGGECTANPERAQARCNIYKKVLVAFNINEVADCSGCT